MKRRYEIMWIGLLILSMATYVGVFGKLVGWWL